MAYSELTNAEIDPDSPVNQQMLTKLRDNPLEIFSGATGYMNAGNWVPVDWAFGSRSGTGVIYDHSVDGTVANIDYTLEDGWEYIFLVEVEHGDNIDTINLQVLVSQNNGSTFPSVNLQSQGIARNTSYGAMVVARLPRVNGIAKRIDLYRSDGNKTDDIITGDAIDKIRFRLTSSESITGGTIRAFRRREYITAS